MVSFCSSQHELLKQADTQSIWDDLACRDISSIYPGTSQKICNPQPKNFFSSAD